MKTEQEIAEQIERGLGITYQEAVMVMLAIRAAIISESFLSDYGLFGIAQLNNVENKLKGT
jgi:adenine deaminase